MLTAGIVGILRVAGALGNTDQILALGIGVAIVVCFALVWHVIGRNDRFLLITDDVSVIVYGDAAGIQVLRRDAVDTWRVHGFSLFVGEGADEREIHLTGDAVRELVSFKSWWTKHDNPRPGRGSA